MAKSPTPPTPLPSPKDHPDLRPAYSPKGRSTYCLVAAPPEPGQVPTSTLCGKDLDFRPNQTERGMIRRSVALCPSCNNLDPVDDTIDAPDPDDTPTPEAA